MENSPFDPAGAGMGLSYSIWGEKYRGKTIDKNGRLEYCARDRPAESGGSQRGKEETQ